jgi:hypothetical protein
VAAASTATGVVSERSLAVAVENDRHFQLGYRRERLQTGITNSREVAQSGAPAVDQDGFRK